MRDEDLNQLLKDPFQIVEGAEIFLIYSPDDSKQYLRSILSSGYPMKILELHSKDNERAVATVFSYLLGKRFVVVFDFDDVRLV